MFSQPAVDLYTLYEEWEDNDKDILKWIRIAYDSDEMETYSPNDRILLKQILLPIYYSETPLNSMSLSQFFDTMNGVMYYMFCQPDAKRDRTWVETIKPLINNLRNRAYYYAVNQLPTSILDVVEFHLPLYNTTTPENIPDEEDYHSDSEKKTSCKQREDIKRKIMEMKSRSLLDIMNCNNFQYKCTTFEYSNIMANYFREIDLELKKTYELHDVHFIRDLNIKTFDLTKLRKFLCDFFKNSPKIKEMTKKWIDYLNCKKCFAHSVSIRTNQSSKVNCSTVMTYMFAGDDISQILPSNIKEMMKMNNRLYSDCLLFSYSKQSSRGDFINALIRPKSIGGVCINYISTTGEWEVKLPGDNMLFRFPSLCHGFYFIRSQMQDQTKLLCPKNTPKGFTFVDENELFNLPEIVDFDQMDEYLF